MGLNNEWSDQYWDPDYPESGDDDNSDFYEQNFTFEDYCDYNSVDLLNIWFTLQENAQLYYHVNNRITFTNFCEFMYYSHDEDNCSQLDNCGQLDNCSQLDGALWNLWYSIGSPKTFYEFYIFYK
jgi:hypothetical protein